MKKRDMYNGVALALVLIGEFFAIRGIHSARPVWWWVFAVIVACIFVTLWYFRLKPRHRSGFNSIILTKLLANAIAPRFLSTAYLLIFVVHLGWLSNAVFELFMPSGYLPDVVTAIVVNVIAMIALIMAYPNAVSQKEENAKKVFLSGISAANKHVRNLQPIVQMLQLAKEDSCCEIVILHSDYYSRQESKATTNSKEYFEYLLDSVESEELKTYFIRKYSTALDITACLAILIRMSAVIEFPEIHWLVDEEKFKITFSEQCNYSRYDECYGVLEKIVRKYDTSANALYFNISPGTVNVSALMTLMAIDGLRKLYYYIPEETLADKSDRLVEVNKNDIPLHSLLSQALDSFEMEM